MELCDLESLDNGKIIPVTGPEGSETSRHSHFLNSGLPFSGEVANLTRQKDSWDSFLLDAESIPGT
jgi:hypothetical protein